MSTEEQMAAIGQWAMERAEAKRRRALLIQEIIDAGGLLSKAAEAMQPHLDQQRSVSTALEHVNELIQIGGLNHVRQLLVEVQSLEARISELSAALINAGAE